MLDEKYIREYAKRYSFTIKRTSGKVKLSDHAGNTIDCTDLQGAMETMRVFQTQPLTSPIYEVSEVDGKARIRIAAPNGSIAKRMYKSRMRVSDEKATLTATKITKTVSI